MAPTEDPACQNRAQDSSSETEYIEVDGKALGFREQILRRDEYWDKKHMCWKLVEPKIEVKSKEKLQQHVLLVRRVFDKDMQPTHTEVDVTGPILRGILINIFRDAPGFPLTARKRTLKPEWFFWALNDLRVVATHCREVGDDDSLFEIEAGLTFIAQHHSILLAELSLLSTKTTISYNDLWAIYPPNTLIYGKDALEQDRVWRVMKAASHCKQDGSQEFKIEAEYAETDGIKVGLVSTNLTMPFYEGSVPINTLAYKPLYLLPERELIWADLLARADKQLSFLPHPYKIQEHEGEGVVFGTPDTPSWEQKEPQRFYFRGRVMIDPVKYRAVEQAPLIPAITSFRDFSHDAVSMSSSDGKGTRSAMQLLPEKSTIEAQDLLDPIHDDPDPVYDPFGVFGLPPPPLPPTALHAGELPSRNQRLSTQELDNILRSLTDVDKLLFSGLLFGFSLTDARWAAFSTSHISHVTWRKDMLSSLVISAPVLTSMRQLIQSHSSRAPFDDFVPGKGQGLIGLFSGQPGLGKTFTAEAIAEMAEKPLYSISSGALGSAAHEINTKLRQIMNLCAHWKAVLLLDEADVFLAKRNVLDLERNAIVSVFLRELEYYSGIMILTTNQPEIMDEAFQSRIHFCYRYPALDWRSRRQVWLQFIEKAEVSLGAERVHVDGPGLSELADLEYNGRQIKNAVSIAMTLAGGSEGRLLSTESILKVARTLQAFDFSAPGESDVDD
ncbi:hypothetical protein CERZMDRAFT_107513 [Cercospora zeae-maydis SCOH1-5]|uniref:AAA+ ATPase domain-containing protein n=1 Tax=Cercospora zeae-maydis SCOH1-5 TaxID=717836 RepID=A0A6A6F1U8_9PEZI|nr:hypothetical protein CERZMDRAFT_107513 [Cercospora zeae-maydis SCOH1-5]